mmetsp:Transcript_37428/g.105644  ORF Transcript_37428/g.105644 Transcript_37428/m.105644 type:complete len:341 (+) Transcript_37428:221-1243(+)
MAFPDQPQADEAMAAKDRGGPGSRGSTDEAKMKRRMRRDAKTVQSEAAKSQPATNPDAPPVNGWYKSRSKSLIQPVPGGIRWSPVKKPTTLHSYFEGVDFTPGSEVQITLTWESDGCSWKGSNLDFDGSVGDPTSQGRGVSDRYLRCMAGTGDFRIGFFQRGEKLVGHESFEGDEEGAATEFNDYRGFQVRIHPHLSEGFENLNGRLIEHHSDGRREPHNNISLWTRIEPGVQGLMSDQAQRVAHSGFSKSHGWGTQPQPWGPCMPFAVPRELKIVMKRVDTATIEVRVTLNGKPSPLLKGVFNADFAPEMLDCMAITYTNQSRRYEYVQLTNLNIRSLK